MIEERLQVRIARIHHPVIGLIGAVDVGGNIHRVIVPVLIFKYDVAHRRQRRTERLRSAIRRPSEFGAGHEMRFKQNLARFRILQRRRH